MAEESPQANRAELSGAAFLEELERKHQRVLVELDDLNARIESVLHLYLSSRQKSPDDAQAPRKAA